MVLGVSLLCVAWVLRGIVVWTSWVGLELRAGRQEIRVTRCHAAFDSAAKTLFTSSVLGRPGTGPGTPPRS